MYDNIVRRVPTMEASRDRGRQAAVGQPGPASKAQGDKNGTETKR